jgi:ADP-heptose:LPS heptosyltransferase
MDVGRHGFCYHRLLPRTVTRDGRKVKLYTMDFNREVAGMLNLKRDPIPGSGSRYQTGFEAAPSDHRWAEEFLSGKDRGEGFIGLVPGAKYQAKNFPAEKFLEFISIVTAETGYRPVIIWGPGEERIADYIAGSSPEALKPPLTGISRLGALISRLQCVVGVDSGPKHLAVIQGIPTVTIFGPTDPEVWDPMTERHRVVRSNLNCSPCGLTECSDVSCMKRIEAGELFKEMKKAVRCNDPKRGIE